MGDVTMGIIKNMKVKVKLIAAFLIMVIIIAGIGGVGTVSLKKI
mgnify:FL=1